MIALRMFTKSHAVRHLGLSSRAMSQDATGRLAGKVAVVTASTDGIGLAIARRLLADGASVSISSRRPANVERAVQELRAGAEASRVLGVVCNVAKEEDRKTLVDQTLSQFGSVDVLVSNAATNPAVGGVLSCSGPLWDKIFDVNVKSALMLTQLLAPHMQERGSGSIVYVSSIGAYHPMPLLGPYCVSKTALLGLAKAAAQELAADGVRVNCVAPGIIRTKFSEMLHSNEDISETALEGIPMGRFGESPEVAALVSFLASDDASYVTGENFPVAGGMPSRL